MPAFCDFYAASAHLENCDTSMYKFNWSMFFEVSILAEVYCFIIIEFGTVNCPRNGVELNLGSVSQCRMTSVKGKAKKNKKL